MTYRVDVSLVDEIQDQGLPIGGKRIRESIVLSGERSERLEAITWAVTLLSDIGGLDRAPEQQGRTEDALEDARAERVAAFIRAQIHGMISSIVADPDRMWLNGNAKSSMDIIERIVRECIQRHG